MGKAKDCAVFRWTAIAGLLAAASAANAADPNSPGELLQRPPPIVAPTPAPALRAAPTPAVPAEAATGRTITVQGFKFTGNTLFDNAALAALVEGYRNKPLSLAQLYEAADVIGNHYVSQGYLLASAVIPAQNVTDGSVTIEVLEGRVESLRFEGLKSYRSDDLLTYLPEIEGMIYRGTQFERGLRDIDELPGLSGKAVLKPGKTYGSTEVVIEAKEKRIEGEVFYDNSGRETVGERRMAGQVTVNNPGGTGDAFTLLGLRSTNDNLQYLYGNYSVPLGVGGARLSASYGYARFRLDSGFEGVKGSNRSARGELSVPVVRDAADRFTVTLAVSDTNADTDLTGVARRKTDLTLFEVSGNYAHTWADRAVTQLSGTIGSNFGVLEVDAEGNSDNDQRFRLETDLQHFQPLVYGLQLLTRTTFVFSPDPLPDTQAFSLGGPASVRGYAPSEARGDWGYFGSITLRRPFQLTSLVLVPRIFGDAGSVRSQDPAGLQPELSLSSAGVGADINYRNLTGRLDYSIPMDGRKVSDGRDDGRLYGSIALSF